MNTRFILTIVLAIVLFLLWLLFNIGVIIQMRKTYKTSELYKETKLQQHYANFIVEYDNLIKTLKIDFVITILIIVLLIFLFVIVLYF